MPFDLAGIFDPDRRQYNSSKLLLQILAAPPPGATRVMAVADVDLFIPILTFVFGEAQLDGIAAVVSLHRLNSKFYGLPENRNVLTERLVKESIHELGHTFGLLHCRQPGCVMNTSTYVEDIDQKSVDMCDRCREQLRVRQHLQVEKERL
jgi:archaemetzincin